MPLTSHFRFKPAPIALAVALAAGTLASATALAQTTPAATTPSTYAIALPAQPLGHALNELARQAGLQLLVRRELVEGKQAPAVSGNLTARQALDRLLAGSGLAASIEGTSVVVREASPQRASEAELATVTVTASASPGDGREYPDSGYTARGSTAGGKVEMSLKDIPQSVAVINQELLRDLAPTRINQVADYVAGVDTFASAATPYTNAFFFRGFGSTSSTTYNGFRDGGFLSAQAPVNLERIEFLKGPSSVLYGGSTGLSGLVNFVSKKPLAEAQHEVVVGAGSFNHAHAQLDTTGPLTEDKRLRYRLTASYDHDGSHLDHYDQGSKFISPYLRWDLTERTQLDVELVAQNTQFDGRENFLPRHPVSFSLPVETNLGPGGRGEDSRRVARVDLKHRFDGAWILRQGIYASNVDKTEDFSYQFLGVHPDGRTGMRRVRSLPEMERDRSSQTELSGAFKTGALTHELLAGVEFSKQRFAYDFLVAPATGVDLFNPQPGVQTGPLTLNGDPNESGADTRALYVQDLIDLTRGFKLMVGGRYDEVEQFSHPRGSAPAADGVMEEKAFSPRVGLIYQPVEATSLYASYAKSFSPQLGLSRTGEAFEPQQGVQLELGVKHDLRPDLTITAAVFDYKRENVLTTDPAAPAGSGFNIAVGEQQSRGFELELSGRVTRDYSIAASYAFLDAKITRDNRLPVGDRLAGVPKHSFGIFNKLRLSALGAPGWSATLGLVHASERESGLPNNTVAFTSEQLRIPSFTKLDVGLIYENGPYTLRLTGTNLTNQKIYHSQGSSLYTRAPRAWQASLGIKF